MALNPFLSAGLSAVSSGLSSLMGNKSAKRRRQAFIDARNKQHELGMQGVAERRKGLASALEALQAGQEADIARVQPFEEGGKEAFQQAINAMIGDTSPEEIFAQTPAFRALLAAGQNAIENSAAARGNLQSGQTLKALENFGQQQAMGAYQNYLDNLIQASGFGERASRVGTGVGAQVASLQDQASRDIQNAFSRLAGLEGQATQGAGLAASQVVNPLQAALMGALRGGISAYGFGQGRGSVSPGSRIPQRLETGSLPAR